MRRAFATLFLLLASLPSVARAQDELVEARAAYARGEFQAAVVVLRSAADAGNATAAFELALMHANGFGVRPDLRVAASWLRRAADAGHVDAQYEYGALVYRGQAVVQDRREAAHWFRLAAERGHASAQLNLGLMYERGDGVRQDNIEAHKWINLSIARFPDSEQRLRSTAIRARDRITQQLSISHLMLAERLASDWSRQAAVTSSTAPLR